MISLIFKIQWSLFKYSNKSNKFHLKMESYEETATAIVALLLNKKIRKKRKRSLSVKPWLGRRINLGFLEMLVQELRFKDKLDYKKTPVHDDAWLWWDFGTYLRWYNQSKYKYVWFNMSQHKISCNNMVFGNMVLLISLCSSLFCSSFYKLQSWHPLSIFLLPRLQ